MSDGENDLHIRPGRIRSTRAPRAKSFVNQVLAAASRSGPVPAGSSARAAKSSGRSTFGRGRIAFSRARLFSPARRIIVKARVTRHTGRAHRAAPLVAHVAYLKRDGVTRDGERAAMFDAETDRADDAAFAARCREDRHHFRFIVSPEDAADLADLRAFTRDLARQMEADLGTRLDWVAVDHWNTDNPHVHLLVRGVDETGADLVISRDYISRGLRSRAEDLVAIELGPKSEHEIQSALSREVTAERWTRLDAEIRLAADDTGVVDLRPEAPGPADPPIRRLMIARLQHLETMGLAGEAGPGEWMVGLDAERRLRDLGRRIAIVDTMQRAFAARGLERAVADFAIHDGSPAGPAIVGRLVGRGLHDELTGEAFAVIDGTDGRAHHVRFRSVDAFAHAAPDGGIVELRRLDGSGDLRPTLILAVRSDLDLDGQVTAPGATWLDHRLVERDPLPLAAGGFGREVRDALDARTDHLVAEGLARRDGRRVLLQRNLLDTLRRRELEAIAAALAAETGLEHRPSAAGDPVTGTVRQRLTLSSGRFAVIEGIGPGGTMGFELVPWSATLDAKLGRHVTGIEWSIGRRRGLGR